MKSNVSIGRRILRLAKRVGVFLLSVFIFGVVVSWTSYCRTPEVIVAATPDSTVKVDEVTRLHPVTMARVVTPRSIEDIVNAVKATPGPVSIGGGRYSMGGQTATPGALQIDMRRFNRLNQLPKQRPGDLVFPYTALPADECAVRTPQPAGCALPAGI